MPEYQLPGAAAPAFKALDDFTQGYIEAMFFTENDKDEVPEDAGFEDLAAESLEDIQRQCAKFQEENTATLTLAYQIEARGGYSAEQAGRDFWFTRNRHGVGFWDRHLGATGDTLTEAANRWSEVYLYMGDDKKLHHH